MSAKVETFFDPVLGVITFATPDDLQAWLAADVDPSSEMSDFDGIFYDLAEFGPEEVKKVLDDCAGRGMNVKIEDARVLLFGCPGEGLVGHDDVPLVAACLAAAEHAGDGVVLFTGTIDDEGSDFALVIGDGGYKIRWFRAGYPPPKLPISPEDLVRTLGPDFDEDEVESSLSIAGYKVSMPT